LIELVERRRGQEQPAVVWSRDRWAKKFPNESSIEDLPEALNRQRVRQLCAAASVSAKAARSAFLASMVWGYGKVGYGPWRIARALDDREAGQKLRRVVSILQAEGPDAAYRALSGPCRLERLGPAFGTKFLYFIDPGQHGRRALILDRLVSRWLVENTGLRLNPATWSSATYTAYLDHMHEWADGLEVGADEVELAIFQEMSEAEQNQWTGIGL
jgi:hypothetical protein